MCVRCSAKGGSIFSREERKFHHNNKVRHYNLILSLQYNYRRQLTLANTSAERDRQKVAEMSNTLRTAQQSFQDNLGT